MNFYKESKSNKKNLAAGKGSGGGVDRVRDLFFFQKESKSEKKCFLFEGVKVRKGWLV